MGTGLDGSSVSCFQPLGSVTVPAVWITARVAEGAAGPVRRANALPGDSELGQSDGCFEEGRAGPLGMAAEARCETGWPKARGADGLPAPSFFCSGSMGRADGAAKLSAKDLYGELCPQTQLSFRWRSGRSCWGVQGWDSIKATLNQSQRLLTRPEMSLPSVPPPPSLGQLWFARTDKQKGACPHPDPLQSSWQVTQ